MPFLLIIAEASKQHKRTPQQVFPCNIKALHCFYGMVCVHSIRGFLEFPVDPYYEPLAWFTIKGLNIIYFLNLLHMYISCQSEVCVTIKPGQ